MAKKIAIIILFVLLFQNTALWNENLTYPVYFGTKKCEINTIKDTRSYATYSDGTREYYGDNGNLYKNWVIYKNWAQDIFVEFDGNIVYGIENGKKTDIYENDKKITSVDWFNSRSSFYDKYTKQYILEVTVNSKDYILSNWKLVPYADFTYHTRYFSDNNTFSIDNYFNKRWMRLEKDEKTILTKAGYSLDSLKVSNDGKEFSAIVRDTSNNNTFIKNGVETKDSNVVYFQYSPSGNDLFSVEKISDTYVFYKNDIKIVTFTWVVKNSFHFNFTSDADYSIILTDWEDYALIKDGKIVTSYKDANQTKAIIKKDNWDLFVVKRDKSVWKDTLEINWKKIIEAKDIDERYLMDWVDTFSLFPNKTNSSDEYYTFIKTDDNNYYLFVNGFIVRGYYDYLKLTDWLDQFEFASASGQWNVVCKDITHTYQNSRYTRQDLERFLSIATGLDNDKKTVLREKFKKLSVKNDFDKELVKMFLDNLR